MEFFGRFRVSLSHHLKGVASSLKEWSSCSLGDLEKRLKHEKKRVRNMETG